MVKCMLETYQFANVRIVTAVSLVAFLREQGIKIEFGAFIFLVIFFDEASAGEPVLGDSHEA